MKFAAFFLAFLTVSVSAETVRRKTKSAKSAKSSKAGAIMATKTYTAVLNAAQEGLDDMGNPACSSTAMGSAVLTVSGDELCYYISFSGTATGQEVAGSDTHIHEGVVGQNGGVIVFLESGTNPKIACTAVTPEIVATMDAGGAYINHHTTLCPGGEIRGQIFMT